MEFTKYFYLLVGSVYLVSCSQGFQTSSGAASGSKSSSASATSSPAPTPSPAPSPAPTPTPSPSPNPAPAPSPSPSPSPAPTSSPSTGSFSFTQAPDMPGVTILSNRDSVKIFLPWVQGAVDYRAIILSAGSSVTTLSSGAEQILGSTMWCAGEFQRNSPDTVWIYDKPGDALNLLKTVAPGLQNDSSLIPYVKQINVQSVPLQQIEITGITQATSVYIEAIDTLCPFTGIIGSAHREVAQQQAFLPEITSPSGNFLTEVTQSEVTSKYGNLIYNGQRHDSGTLISSQAAASNPKVLARTLITVSPDQSAPVPKAFFDDFSNEKTFVSMPVPADVVSPVDGTTHIVTTFQQNDKWNIYGTSAPHSETDPSFPYTYDVFVRDGVLHTILGDFAQDVGASTTLIPRATAHLNDNGYLHVTFEVNGIATDRRYWAFALCGPETTNSIFKADGSLSVVHTLLPRWQEYDGLDPNTNGWNCLQVAPFNGTVGDMNFNHAVQSPLGPNQVQYYENFAPSDMRVIVNKSLGLAPGQVQGWGVNSLVPAGSGNTINVSPQQDPYSDPSWYYQMNSTGKLVSTPVILESEFQAQPRQKYDLYIKRDRLVLYINGTQRLCNDFPEAPAKLTMAEGYLAFEQTMYHSAAEHSETTQDPHDCSGQHYTLKDIIATDEKTWDNIGFDENVQAPTDFNSGLCFVHHNAGAANNE